MIQSMTATPNIEENWLATLNSYRQSSGVNPVKENLRFSVASQHHADYLAMTTTDYQVGKYQNLHNDFHHIQVMKLNLFLQNEVLCYRKFSRYQ